MSIVLKEIGKKNEKVFKLLFDEHYKELVTYANKYLFDKNSSEDIVQDVFIYLWENAGDLKVKSSLIGYIYAMVRNRCLNFLKSIKITDNYDFIENNINLITNHTFDTAPEDDKKLVYHQISKIVDSLPLRMQQVVKLKFIHNYQYQEIAKELNISVNTVKTQLKRAKLKITDMLSVLLILLEINK